MSKKSAKTKGYRNFKKDKQADSEKEFRTMIIGLIVVVAVVAIAMIGIKVYDNIGKLKVDGYNILGVGENWIIKNTGSQAEPKVFKMAELNEVVEGYTLEPMERHLQYSQSNYYMAEDENNPIDTYCVTVATGNHDVAVYNGYDKVGGFGAMINQSEIKTGTAAGKDFYYYTLQYFNDQSEAGDGSDIHYRESLNAYFDSEFEGYSIMVSIINEAADANSFNTEEDLMALLEKVAEDLVITSRFEK